MSNDFAVGTNELQFKDGYLRVVGNRLYLDITGNRGVAFTDELSGGGRLLLSDNGTIYYDNLPTGITADDLAARGIELLTNRATSNGYLTTDDSVIVGTDVALISAGNTHNVIVGANLVVPGADTGVGDNPNVVVGQGASVPANQSSLVWLVSNINAPITNVDNSVLVGADLSLDSGNANNSINVGNENTIGPNAIAIGRNINVVYDNSIGLGGSTTSANQVMLGKNTQVVFVPGNILLDVLTAANSGTFLTFDASKRVIEAAYGEIDISQLQTDVAALSAAAGTGAHNSLSSIQGGTSDQRYHLSLAQYNDYIGSTEVANATGSLQTQIDSIVQEGTTITSSGGTLVVSQNGLQYNLEVYDYVSDTQVANVTASLQSQIDNIDVTPNVLGTGAVNITSNETIVPVTDQTYKLGSDTRSWLGIWLGGSEITIDNGVLKVDGVEISGSGGGSGSSTSTSGDILQGTVPCITSQNIYTVNHDTIDVNQIYPFVSLTTPGSGSLLYVQGIYDRTPSSFKVYLSNNPEADGYYINWLLAAGVNVTGVDISDEIGTGTVNITSNESIIPSTDDTYTLGTSGNSWSSIWLSGSEITVDGGTLKVDGVEISGSGGGSGSVTSLIGVDGIEVIESPADTWTISVSGDYATSSEIAALSGAIDTNIVNINSLQTQVDGMTGNLYQGSEPCIVDQKLYTISHGTVDTTQIYPHVSLVAPTSASTLYIAGILNQQSGQFDVVLSGTPSVTGYAINWLMIDSIYGGGGGGTAEAIEILQVSSTTTLIRKQNQYVGVLSGQLSGDGGFYLPQSPQEGDKVELADEEYLASTYNVDVSGNGYLINEDSYFTMNQNGQSFFLRFANGRWRIF